MEDRPTAIAACVRPTRRPKRRGALARSGSRSVLHPPLCDDAGRSPRAAFSRRHTVAPRRGPHAQSLRQRERRGRAGCCPAAAQRDAPSRWRCTDARRTLNTRAVSTHQRQRKTRPAHLRAQSTVRAQLSACTVPGGPRAGFTRRHDAPREPWPARARPWRCAQHANLLTAATKEPRRLPSPRERRPQDSHAAPQARAAPSRGTRATSKPLPPRTPLLGLSEEGFGCCRDPLSDARPGAFRTRF